MTARAAVVLLGRDCAPTRMLYHALTAEFGDIPVILERSGSPLRLALRRARKLGWLAAVGQVLFRAVVQPVLGWCGRRRIQDIKDQYGLKDEPIDRAIIEVSSANSSAAHDALRRLNPVVIVLSGARILSADTLRAVGATFINLHAGITPAYRGVHGGYWALVENRSDLVGTTVHLVDEGIDTGPIVEQATFAITSSDNLATYPYLHTACGLPALTRTIRAALDGNPGGRNVASARSPLRFHPTVWGYLWTRWRLGVR